MRKQRRQRNAAEVCVPAGRCRGRAGLRPTASAPAARQQDSFGLGGQRMANFAEALRHHLSEIESKLHDVFHEHLPVIRETIDRIDSANDAGALQELEGLVLNGAERDGVKKFLDKLREKVDALPDSPTPAPASQDSSGNTESQTVFAGATGQPSPVPT